MTQDRQITMFDQFPRSINRTTRSRVPIDPFGFHPGEVNLAKSSVYRPTRGEPLTRNAKAGHRPIELSVDLPSPSVRRSRSRLVFANLSTKPA